VKSRDVWKELEDFDPHVGAFGRQLEALKIIRDAVGPDVPLIQTIYLPFHFGVRLADRRIITDLSLDPGAVESGLKTIARNTIRFAKAALMECGIDGFFYGAYGCEESWMTEPEYGRLVMPLDREVIEGIGPVPVSILHVHGEGRTFFRLCATYPVAALSWEDRTAGPSLKSAAALTDKCLVGGVNHLRAEACSAVEVLAECREAIRITGHRGLILAPGCTFLPETPPENMHALRNAVLE